MAAIDVLVPLDVTRLDGGGLTTIRLESPTTARAEPAASGSSRPTTSPSPPQRGLEVATPLDLAAA